MSTVDDIMVLADRYAEENSPPLGEYLQRRDELRAALESFAAEREQAGRSEPEQGEPLTDAHADELWRAAYRADRYRHGSFDWYLQGLRDGERAHGIGDE